MRPEVVVLAVDPDSQASGLVLATRDRVLAVGLASTLNGRRGLSAVQNQITELRRLMVALCSGGPVTHVVSETPQDYGEYRRKVDPNNLMLLSIVSGAVLGIGGTFVPQANCHLVTPSQWKGQRSKDADHKITLEHYGWPLNGTIPDDVAVMTDVPRNHMKEVVDAMGIARWFALKQRRTV